MPFVERALRDVQQRGRLLDREHGWPFIRFPIVKELSNRFGRCLWPQFILGWGYGQPKYPFSRISVP